MKAIWRNVAIFMSILYVFIVVMWPFGLSTLLVALSHDSRST
jgi:hypothetical protein